MLLSRLRILFTVALLSGMVSGALLSVLHLTITTPLILQAERFEAPESGPAEWMPADGLERTIYTMAADLLLAVGFASLLVAVFSLLKGKISLSQAAIMGCAGFLAFVLAPSLGLPPELPGTEAAPLLARQAWWLGTAFSTLAGLGMIFYWRKPLPIALGLALLIIPHVIGAPGIVDGHSTAPENIQQLFRSMSIVIGGIFWLMLGLSSGFFYQRFYRSLP